MNTSTVAIKSTALDVVEAWEIAWSQIKRWLSIASQMVILQLRRVWYSIEELLWNLSATIDNNRKASILSYYSRQNFQPDVFESMWLWALCKKLEQMQTVDFSSIQITFDWAELLLHHPQFWALYFTWDDLILLDVVKSEWLLKYTADIISQQ